MTSDQQSHIGRPIRRAEDDELLGFVMPSTDGSQRYCATSVFGGLLGIHQDPIDAERQVTEVGLPSLAERWWVFAGGRWQRCQLIEAAPDRVVGVIGDFPFTGRPQVIPRDTPLRLLEPGVD